MSSYYVNVNAQPTGEHEVHKDSCSRLPHNKIYLGTFSTCQEAVKAAKIHYTNVDGCYYCSPTCHTK